MEPLTEFVSTRTVHPPDPAALLKKVKRESRTMIAFKFQLINFFKAVIHDIVIP